MPEVVTGIYSGKLFYGYVAELVFFRLTDENLVMNQTMFAVNW